MINGTKLLTLTAMTAGRKGALLKSEKIRHTVKLGPTHLKGVWIPFERALELANAEKIVESLYPLFVHDIGSLARKTSDQKLTRQNEPQLKSEEVGEAAGSSRAISAHSFLTKDDDKDLQPLAVDTVQDTELLKPGILGSLFRSLIETMGLIMKEVKSQCSEAGHYVSLESTCAALLFWGNDLGLPQGKLDDKLQYSPHLRDTCITVLVSIARFVSTSLIGLVMTRVRQEQILQSTGISILLKHVTHNGQQQGFTYFPEQDAEMLCQALRTKIDTLIMLAPSLASPTEEVSDEEESGAIQDVNETLPGEAFAERVAKMLPLAPPDIVARLGTLNWDRYSHILQLQREATQEEMVTTTMEKIRSASHKSGLDVSATAPSAVKVETELIHEPSMLSESGGASHKRAPSLSVRTCNICGKDVRSKATTEWK
ncbi:hypothetical protein J4E81_001774 [Alternaria sp. BMP 2799]|nr:hypothetical protein J4E81_001774 [Alternaria sp. BMP 2799]